MSKIPISLIDNKYLTFNADGKKNKILRLCLHKFKKKIIFRLHENSYRIQNNR